MVGKSWLQPLAGNRLMRRFADAGLVRYAHRRTLALDRMDIAAVQERTLFRLLRKARNTQFARDHEFHRIKTIADYQARVPLREYEDFWKQYWGAVYPKLDGTTWPEKIPYYALSSGTTSGATKYVPISRQMLASNRKCAFTTLALFRHMYPKAHVFTGRVFFLGGSTTMRLQEDGSYGGDLSGIAIKEMTDITRPFLFPTLDLAHLSNWEEKVEHLAKASITERITVLSMVPSWGLILFRELKKATGKSRIIDIWPDLKLIVHGGTRFDPYRELFRQEIGSDEVKFLDTYPASEGYIATEDPRFDLLRLFVDHNIFFEFVPVEELGKDRPTRHTVANVELGVQYAVVMTTCAGLWAYVPGDTIVFERRDPLCLRFSGRTKYFLSAFGEHLISEEVETAITEAAKSSNAMITDFHVGPIFARDSSQPGHHRYLIEFRQPPTDIQQFT